MKLWMTFVYEPRPLSWQCNCNLANCRGGFQLENLKKGNLANSRSGNRTGPPCLWPCGHQSATSPPPPSPPCVSLFYPWQCSLSCQSSSTQFSVHTTWRGTPSLVFLLSLVSLFPLLRPLPLLHAFPFSTHCMINNARLSLSCQSFFTQSTAWTGPWLVFLLLLLLHIVHHHISAFPSSPLAILASL